MNSALADVITEQKETVMRLWEDACKAHLASAREVDHATRRDSMPKLIDALIKSLCTDGVNSKIEKNEAAREHGEDRANSEGYSLKDVIVEYRLFRQTLIQTLRKQADCSAIDMDFINDFIDSSIQKSTEQYLEIERIQKQKSDESSQKLREIEKALELQLRDAKEEAERSNSAKSSFLANMSHEIRSPLGAIMGFSELLKTPDLLPSDLENYVRVIDRNAKHLLNIVDDILDLSKVEAGKMSIEHLDFSLTALLEDVKAIMTYRARDKGVEFRMKSTMLPERIISDPTRLRQILNNIVGNAIKFTEYGLVQLSISLEENTLRFSVSDTGPGIEPDRISKLFQPFEQADISTTRRFGGTGLGLVLTKRLAEVLGGTFKLDKSTLGLGSVFSASVVIEVSKLQQKVAVPQVPLPQKMIRLDGLRVLVVEDSPDNQTLFTLMLGNAGASVDIAQDGYEGINLARTNDYDVVLMDVQMPRMDGHQATQALRALNYDVPIIALTAHAMIEERDRATESGFTGFLSKPISRVELLSTLALIEHRTHKDQQQT
jgi:signal transduction histidine kinase/CheY-like chemotaxis protein